MLNAVQRDVRLPGTGGENDAATKEGNKAGLQLAVVVLNQIRPTSPGSSLEEEAAQMGQGLHNLCTYGPATVCLHTRAAGDTISKRARISSPSSDRCATSFVLCGQGAWATCAPRTVRCCCSPQATDRSDRTC